MNTRRSSAGAGTWLAAGVGLVAGAYITRAAVTWHRYGHRTRARSLDEADALLDQFMPDYEVVERHQVRVAAPAEITLTAAQDEDLLASPAIRAIFKARELLLGGTHDDRPRPRPMLPLMQSFGWGILADIPGREVVLGAVTKPWEPNPTFRAIPPTELRAFREPGYVKIAWTLRADPLSPGESMFRTETRATSTDPTARAQFRRYWSLVSTGVGLIRRLSLRPLKADAERRARAATSVCAGASA